jgi:hypothetical protein
MRCAELTVRQAIESAATTSTDSGELRKATIFGDAVLAIINSPTMDVNGKCVLDEDFLRAHEGVTDFDKYSVSQS